MNCRRLFGMFARSAVVWLAATPGTPIAAETPQQVRSEHPGAGTSKGNRPARVISFYADTPEHLIAVTSHPRFALAAFPADVPRLVEPKLGTGLALMTKLRDSSGEIVGFASELEEFPQIEFRPNEDVRWKTWWTLVIPGRGSLYGYQIEHLGGLPEKVISPMMQSRKDWQGDFNVTTTVGPGKDGRGIIMAGTGEFARARGSFIEIDNVYKFTVKNEMFAHLEIRFFLE